MPRARPLRPHRLPAVLAAAVVTLALAGCGDDDGGGGGGARLEIGDARRADYDLVVEAHDIDFDEDQYEVAAGPVAVGYIEEGSLLHNLSIRDGDGVEVPITGGDEGKLVVTSRTDAAGTVTLAAGTYELICTIPGHADAGMKAELTVT